eukprot:1588766-Amphidinium_carterae.1
MASMTTMAAATAPSSSPWTSSPWTVRFVAVIPTSTHTCNSPPPMEEYTVGEVGVSHDVQGSPDSQEQPA